MKGISMEPCLHPATLRQGLNIPTLIRAATQAGFRLIELSARSLINASNDDPAQVRLLVGEHNVTPVHTGWSAGLRSSRADFEAALPDTEAEMAFAVRVGSRGGTLVLPFRREPNVPDPDEADVVDRIQRLAAIAA